MQILHIEYVVSANAEFFQDTTWVTWVGLCSRGTTMAGGLISSPMAGRRSRDAQLFFVNGRPIDPPKRVAKLINVTRHRFVLKKWYKLVLDSLDASTNY